MFYRRHKGKPRDTKRFTKEKHKLKVVDSYIKNRDTNRLNALLKKAPEVLLELITPYDVTNKGTEKQ